MEVLRVLVEIMDLPQAKAVKVVDLYRTSISEGSVSEQILAYHHGTLSVAAELAGIQQLTLEMRMRYARLIDPNRPSARGIPD
jgi:hypothetical protein